MLPALGPVAARVLPFLLKNAPKFAKPGVKYAAKHPWKAGFTGAAGLGTLSMIPEGANSLGSMLGLDLSGEKYRRGQMAELSADEAMMAGLEMGGMEAEEESLNRMLRSLPHAGAGALDDGGQFQNVLEERALGEVLMGREKEIARMSQKVGPPSFEELALRMGLA